MTTTNIILTLLTILNLFLGVFVLRKNFKSNINISYFLFAVGISAWAVTNAIFQATNNYFIAFVVCILAYYAGALIALPFFYFTLVFPAGYSNLKNYHKYVIALWAAIWFIILTVPDITLKGVSLEGPIRGLITGPGLSFHFLSIAILMFGGIINLIIKYFKVKGFLKWQIAYVLFGVFIMTFFGMIFNLILPFLHNYSFVWLGPMFSSFVLGTTAYAIVRYHLMDIKFIIRLGTVYAVLFGLIMIVYVFLCGEAGRYVGEPWEYVIPSIIITFSFIPLKNFIELATDKIFFRKRYKFSEVISKIEEGVHSAGLNLDKALSATNQTITQALKVKRAVILILIPKDHFISRQIIDGGLTNLELKRDNPIITYLNIHKGKILDKEELARDIHEKDLSSESSTEAVVNELERIEFSLAVPIELKSKLIGVYLLGSKLSQDPFSGEDIKLLKHVTWEMGFAIDNAKSFEELKRLDEAKSQFISVASHQLRTPTAIVRWNLELALDKKMQAAEKKKSLESAYGGIISLGSQLDQLMVALEIEEGSIVLRKEEIDLARLINDYAKNMERKIKDKDLKLSLNLPKDSALVSCDREKIMKVLEAIIGNAATYTPSGGEIAVALNKKNTGGADYFVISVADNGLGVPEEDRSDIFEKFFRDAGAKAVSPNGFGLSLYIAREFIRAHGGDIWLEANSGKGVTFYFTIPQN
ncbi:hypothetical protein HY798_00205 [Candidatus Falkowbacteria bacterium]|nr:hypothetical protein [Candidatus Falkowbacteria bacterium]